MSWSLYLCSWLWWGNTIWNMKAAKLLCIPMVVTQICADVILKHNCNVPICKGNNHLHTETILLEDGSTMVRKKRIDYIPGFLEWKLQKMRMSKSEIYFILRPSSNFNILLLCSFDSFYSFIISISQKCAALNVLLLAIHIFSYTPITNYFQLYVTSLS